MPIITIDNIFNTKGHLEYVRKLRQKYKIRVEIKTYSRADIIDWVVATYDESSYEIQHMINNYYVHVWFHNTEDATFLALKFNGAIV